MKHKVLKITGVLVLLVAVGGFWGYNKYFKVNPEIQQQLKTQFGEDFFSFEDEKGFDNTTNGSKSVDANNTIDSPATESKVPGDSKSETTSTPVNENTASKPLTQEEIKTKYMPRFNHLQNVAMDRLDTLYSAAIQEYLQQKKAGTVNRSALAQKYLQAGNILEANLDGQFNSTLNEMQAELIANNLPTDSIGVIKSEYENAKSSKRSQLLSKIR